jgi:hypothetical protein
MLDLFNRRWSVETTYEEARAHHGAETQRQCPTRRSSGRRRCCSASTASWRSTCSRTPSAWRSHCGGPRVSQGGRDLRRAGATAAAPVVRACRHLGRRGRHDGTHPARGTTPDRARLLRALRSRLANAPAMFKCAKSRRTFVSGPPVRCPAVGALPIPTPSIRDSNDSGATRRPHQPLGLFGIPYDAGRYPSLAALRREGGPPLPGVPRGLLERSADARNTMWAILQAEG